MEGDDVKLIWVMNIQCDHVTEARRSDVVDKKGKSCFIIKIAVPGDCRICERGVQRLKNIKT